MTLSLMLNIGITKRVIDVLSSQRYVTNINHNTKKLQKFLLK